MLDKPTDRAAAAPPPVQRVKPLDIIKGHQNSNPPRDWSAVRRPTTGSAGRAPKK